jgi:hypothetical protein
MLAPPMAETPAPDRSPKRGISPWIWVTIALPLAAIVLYAGARVLRHATAWRFADLRGEAGLSWNGVSYGAADSNALAPALAQGGAFVMGDGTELEFLHPGDLAVGLAGGSAGTITAPPRRLGERAVRIRLERGEARISTGVRFRGTRMAVETPEAELDVGGTTLAVTVAPEGTAVAVLAGAVRLRERGGGRGAAGGGPGGEVVVPEGGRYFLYRGARSPERADLSPEEAERLTRFLERYRDILHE